MATNKYQRLRERGAADQMAGKPIDAYYDLPASRYGMTRHTERGRAAYEIGWRDARNAQRRKQAQA